MKAQRGFTVLELLVASLLLGMLMTILTMIFNQSSIAWRTGVAGVANMDNARADVSDVRCQADDAYEWNGPHYIQSVFDDKGVVRTAREGADGYLNDSFKLTGSITLSLPSENTDATKSYKVSLDVATPTANKQKDSYIVNVMSYGPDRNISTRYDNIYSVSPTDNPDEW